jgi:hypothetical protein
MMCVRFLIGLGLVASAASAGPDWTEAPDAGKNTGQVITLAFQPNSITGSLTGLDADGGIDAVDLFELEIEDPNTIKIATDTTAVVEFRGNANFDASLWLFRMDKRGLLANANANDFSPAARLFSSSTDGTSARIPGPGRYLLAVSFGDVFPVGQTAGTPPQPIFEFNDGSGIFQISGPDGPGGQSPFVNWAGNFVTRPTAVYTITISGLEECPRCPGDANFDNKVNFDDITTVLGFFGTMCTPAAAPQ